MDAAKYNQLLNDNITKAYKKADGNQLKKIDTEAKAMTRKLEIDDRVEVMAQKEAFITLKDHNFANKPTFRLTHLNKRLAPGIGKIRKQILYDINQKLVAATNVN